MKKNSYKKAFNELIAKKESHSKTNDLNYEKLKIQSYLKTDSSITNDEKQLLFKLRTRMTELKSNFKNKYFDEVCSLCKNNDENQSHLMECEILIDECEALKENIHIKYEDIFSTP